MDASDEQQKTITPRQSTDPGLSKPATTDVSLPCLGCDYDLRGLDATRTCPECGKPVGESMFNVEEKRVLETHALGLQALAVSLGFSFSAALLLMTFPFLQMISLSLTGIAVLIEHLLWIAAISTLGVAPSGRTTDDGASKARGIALGIFNLLAVAFLPLSVVLSMTSSSSSNWLDIAVPVALFARYLAMQHAASGAIRFAEFIGSPSFTRMTLLPVWWMRISLLTLTIGACGVFGGDYLDSHDYETTMQILETAIEICGYLAAIGLAGCFIGAIIAMVYAIRARRRILGWVGRPTS